MSNCIGIDLTQSTPHLAIASGPSEVESSVPESSPPAALLPVLKGESIIVGAAAHKHRRGIGDNWPPECQVPVGGNYENGAGRIPMVCAWTRLAQLSNRQFSGFLDDTETKIAWKPPGQKTLHSSVEMIIADSVLAWEKKYLSKKTVVVVPDSLGEAAQQALVDNCGAFLIPRPIAVAMSWCRKNANKFANDDIQSTKGITIGHLLVVTLPFDRWEVVPIEIRAMVYQEKLWLIPIRNRITGGGEFLRLGVNFFLAMASRQERSLECIWKTIFGKSSLSDVLDAKWANTDSYNLVTGCFENGFSPAVKNAFYKLDGWKDMFSGTPRLSLSDFRALLSKIYKQKLTRISQSAQNRNLGVVVDGSCSTIPISENRSVGDFIAKAFEGLESNILNGEEAARGAAITAYALEYNLPSYRETIIPVDIHYHKENEQGDYVNAYKSLVKGKTVKAGKEYKSKKPVRGLNIKQGESKLTLTLRRTEESVNSVFRRVTAEIPKPTTIDEEVKIVAHLRPGQGFAKVFINSVNNSVFSTRLDWRTMKDCDEPPPPPLAYLPEVSRVVHNASMWYAAESIIKSAIYKLRSGDNGLLNTMRNLREEGKFNQWPLADNYDEYHGRPPQGDSFRHYGVCHSDGDLENVSSPSLMKEFAHECAKRFVHERATSAQRKQIQQTASWMYLACPSSIITKVRNNLKNQIDQTKQDDLHTIGLCWCNSEDIELFFIALEQRLLQGTTKVNNWLRACRNIVRFRDAALQPNIIPERRLKNIISRIIRILEGQIIRENFNTIFNNCILTCLYLLKRRRYNRNFLNPENHDGSRIETILEELLIEQANNLNDRQYTIIDITLKFLRKEASMNDIDASVLTG
jgi:hypothetical protein